MAGVAAVVLYFPLAVLRGFVIVTLWGWYATPVFGVAAPGLIHAVGLSLLVWMFMGDRADPNESVTHAVARAAASPLMALAFGWVWSFAL